MKIFRADWTRSALPLLAATFAAMIAGCTSAGGGSKPDVPEIRPGLLKGYLDSSTLPDSLGLLPAPPAAGSAAFAVDEEVARSSVALRDTPRWKLAISDADLEFPQAADVFSCALDASITQENTPRLYQLLRRSLTDAAFATSAAKRKYMRPRPFMVNQAPLCTPEDKASLQKNGSYPSGHAAIGAAWALILSEIAPDRGDAILVRGRAFGESRNVCNVHWRSDVVEARFIGASVVARLHADPIFRADLEAAKTELAAVRAKGEKPTRDCAAEAAALAR